MSQQIFTTFFSIILYVKCFKISILLTNQGIGVVGIYAWKNIFVMYYECNRCQLIWDDCTSIIRIVIRASHGTIERVFIVFFNHMKTA